MSTLSTAHPLRVDDGTAARLPGSFGVQHEEWYAEARRRGAVVIISVTAPDPEEALRELAASTAPMDCWFKEGVQDLTGRDFPSLVSQ